MMGNPVLSSCHSEPHCGEESPEVLSQYGSGLRGFFLAPPPARCSKSDRCPSGQVSFPAKRSRPRVHTYRRPRRAVPRGAVSGLYQSPNICFKQCSQGRPRRWNNLVIAAGDGGVSISMHFRELSDIKFEKAPGTVSLRENDTWIWAKVTEFPRT